MSPPLQLQQLALLDHLNMQRARYLVIERSAVQSHGLRRIAKNLHILVDTFGGNPERVYRAMQGLGLNGVGPTIERLRTPKQEIRIGGGFHSDLWTSIDCFDFHLAYERRVVDIEQSIRVDLISPQDLREVTKILGNLLDRDDVRVFSYERGGRNATIFNGVEVARGPLPMPQTRSAVT